MLSVVVLTKNDQDLIKACLESVKWADQIVVVDNGSTDQTLEIARRYTDNIVKVTGTDFSNLRNKAFDKTYGDWVLYVDSDERVLQGLKDEIGQIMDSPDSKSAYAIGRKNIIFGQIVSYGPYKKDWVIRLFRRTDFKNWTGLVHESVHFNGKLGYCQHSFLHLTHRNLDQIVNKTLDWSKIYAQMLKDAHHPKMRGWRFIRILLSEIWEQGIKRRGFFGGTVGIMDSLLQVFSQYMTYVRLWEMQQAEPLAKKYQEIDQKLIENGFKE